ncbi:MAG: hypothetical protein M3511_14110 [Deinococcota bacterium]|nr:hypothetical protein [Deinococcota bacterium]
MLKQKLASAKEFARNHKTALTVVATATPLLALVMRNAKVTNEFLKEHDLFDEFYQMDEI